MTKTPILLLLALVLAPPAYAFHHDEWPLVASGGTAGVGWASFEVATDGDAFAVDAMVRRISDAGQASVYVFDEAGENLVGFSFTLFNRAREGTLVSAQAPGAPPVHVDTRVPPAGSGYYAGVGTTLTTPGTYKVLVWGSGGIASWDWTVRGGSGVHVASVDGGPEAFLYGAEDFTDAGAHASTAWMQAGAAASAATEKNIHVDDALYAIFLANNFKAACVAIACTDAPGSLALVSIDPDGAAQNCGTQYHTCRWVGDQPGDYTFLIDGADASEDQEVAECVGGVCAFAAAHRDHVILGGADARLPP